jgi:hypothetical protein
MPAWLAAAIGAVAVLAIGLHLLSLPRAAMPPSCRRIRISNGLLMALSVPVIVYAAGMTSPQEPRAFTIAWSSVAALMGLIVLLACLDAANSMRLHVLHRRDLRRQLDHARLELAVHSRADSGAAVAASAGGQSSLP